MLRRRCQNSWQGYIQAYINEFVKRIRNVSNALSSAAANSIIVTEQKCFKLVSKTVKTHVRRL